MAFMKATLSSAVTAKQFRVEIKKGDRRFTFYLGSDIHEAERRKAALYRYTNGLSSWDESSIEIAKTIARGEKVRVRAEENDADSMAAEERLVRAGVPIKPVVTMADLQSAEVQILRERIAALEAELSETAGPRVAQRSTITMYELCDAWHQYRRITAVVPGTTSTPKDAVFTEETVVAFIKRMIQPNTLKLSDLDYAQIDLTCKRIAARPVGLHGTMISRPWARESLKIFRRIIRYAISTYGYRAPVLWHEATKATISPTEEDQKRRRKLKAMILTNDEIKTLYRYTLPSERLVLLLGLNCGFRQSENVGLKDDEIVDGVIDRYRGKSDIFAMWKLWPETIKALEHNRPTRRGSVTATWKRLVERVRKDHPNFQWRSLKWLCKTGSTRIKLLAGAEIASMYLSHGDRSSDDLLPDYAADEWSQLADALMKWHAELALDAVPTTDERTALPLSAIERCKAMWRAGENVKAIMKETGISRATCYRYRVQPD